MAAKKTATSLLEFLTAPNPLINALGATEGRNTSSRKYYRPRQMKAWDDFTFETLESIYECQLMKELQRNDRELTYPFIWHKHESVMEDESTTTEILIRWNQSSVNQALKEVEYTLHPCIWTARKRPAVETPSVPPESSSTPLESNQEHDARKASKTGNTRLRRDMGAISTCDVCQARDLRQSNGTGLIERLPKEVKPGSKWESTEMKRLIGPNQKWVAGVGIRDEVMPVFQAYSYCVDHGCRYGCILTYQEAFIFRIGFIDEIKEKLKLKSVDIKSSIPILRRYGMMEYVSIPWDDTQKGKDNDPKRLTMNLSLWFIHILAGNEHEVALEYGELRNEMLVQHRRRFSTESTQAPEDLIPKPLEQSVQLHENESHFLHHDRKRKGAEHLSDDNDDSNDDDDEEEEEDNYRLSFYQHPVNMTEPRTVPDYLHHIIEGGQGGSRENATAKSDEPHPDGFQADGKKLRRSLRNSRNKRQKP